MTQDAIYLAGPMRGISLYNFPAFDHYAAHLRGMGHTVISPAELDREAGFSEHGSELPDLRECMARDLVAIANRCKAIALMPGWRGSGGVAVELTLAKLLGLEVLDAATGLPFDDEAASQENVLQEAQRLIYGARNESYGHPRDDFAKTALMITGTLLPKLRPGAMVTAKEVGLIMMQLKISREVHKPNRDNMTDAAGYAGCVAMIEGY